MRITVWGILLIMLAATQSGCFMIHVSKNEGVANPDDRQSAQHTAEPCDLADLALPAGELEALAVLDFRVGNQIAADTSHALADLCRATIQDSGQFQLVDRERVAAILGERDFAEAMDCDTTSCIVRYGELIGARKVMHGRINQLGNVYVLAISLTDVETSAQISQSDSLDKLEQATDAVPNLVCRVLHAAQQ